MGIVILAVLFRMFQRETLDYLTRLGADFWMWQFWIIVLIYLFNHVFLTYGWKVLITAPVRASSFYRLVLARIAGDSTASINSLGAVAGEPLKAMYLKDIIPFKTGLASVVLDRTIHTVSNLLLILTGIFVGFFILNIPVYVSALTFALFSSILAFVLFILAKQKRGFIQYIIGMLPGAFTKRFMTDERLGKIRSLDSEIGFIFSSRDNLRHFWISLSVHYVSVLVAGFLEIYLIILFLGVHITMTHALFVYIFGLFLTSAIFFMPANLGTSEGSYSLALSLLGHDPALGLSVGIIRRLRTFVWSAIGMIILLYAGLLKKEATNEEETNL